MPGADASLQHCKLDKDWETLISEIVDDDKNFVTGGLGKLMQKDVLEVWLCYRGDHSIFFLSVIVDGAQCCVSLDVGSECVPRGGCYASRGHY